MTKKILKATPHSKGRKGGVEINAVVMIFHRARRERGELKKRPQPAKNYAEIVLHREDLLPSGSVTDIIDYQTLLLVKSGENGLEETKIIQYMQINKTIGSPTKNRAEEEENAKRSENDFMMGLMTLIK